MSAFDHPNVIYGDDKIVPGAVTREKTARRINDWTIPLEEDEEEDSTRYEGPVLMVGYYAWRLAVFFCFNINLELK